MTLALIPSNSSTAAANLEVTASRAAAAPEDVPGDWTVIASLALTSSPTSALLYSSNSATLAFRISSSFSLPASEADALVILMDATDGLGRKFEVALARLCLTLLEDGDFFADGLLAAEGGLPTTEGGRGETAFSRMLFTDARPFEIGLVNELRCLWLESVLDAGGAEDFLARLPTPEVRRSELGLVGPPEAFLSGVPEVALTVEVLLGTVEVEEFDLDPAVRELLDGLRFDGTAPKLVAVPTGLAGGFCKPVVGLFAPAVTEAEALAVVTAVPAGRFALPRRTGFLGAVSSR